MARSKQLVDKSILVQIAFKILFIQIDLYCLLIDAQSPPGPDMLMLLLVFHIKVRFTMKEVAFKEQT
jgi:hypothetical protein